MSELDRIASVLERALVDLRLPKQPRRKIPVKIVKAIEHVKVVISTRDIMDILRVLGAKIDEQGLDIKALRKYLRLTPDSTQPDEPPAPLPTFPSSERDKVP